MPTSLSSFLSVFFGYEFSNPARTSLNLWKVLKTQVFKAFFFTLLFGPIRIFLIFRFNFADETVIIKRKIGVEFNEIDSAFCQIAQLVSAYFTTEKTLIIGTK